MELRLEKCPKCNSQWNVHPGAINYCSHMGACPMGKIMEGKMETRDLLNERQKTHGDYSVHAKITQELKDRMFDMDGWSNLDDCQKEALHMIVHKIGRILAGNPSFKDHWDDIAGYAKLVADRCQT